MYNCVTHGETFRSLPLKLWKKLWGKKLWSRWLILHHRHALTKTQLNQSSLDKSLTSYSFKFGSRCARSSVNERNFLNQTTQMHTLSTSTATKIPQTACLHLLGMSSIVDIVQYQPYWYLQTFFPQTELNILRTRNPGFALLGFQ